MMSRKLLLNLDGNSNGAFRGWLNVFNGEPRTACIHPLARISEMYFIST